MAAEAQWISSTSLAWNTLVVHMDMSGVSRVIDLPGEPQQALAACWTPKTGLCRSTPPP